jgi:hypothetical protein
MNNVKKTKLISSMTAMFLNKMTQVYKDFVTKDDFDDEYFLEKMHTDIQRLTRLLKQVEVTSKYREEMFINIIEMIKTGLDERKASNDLLSWLCLIPSTIEESLQGYDLLDNEPDIAANLDTVWAPVQVLETSISVHLKRCVAEAT